MYRATCRFQCVQNSLRLTALFNPPPSHGGTHWRVAGVYKVVKPVWACVRFMRLSTVLVAGCRAAICFCGCCDRHPDEGRPVGRGCGRCRGGSPPPIASHAACARHTPRSPSRCSCTWQSHAKRLSLLTLSLSANSLSSKLHHSMRAGAEHPEWRGHIQQDIDQELSGRGLHEAYC